MKLNNETKIGILVAAVLVILCILTIKASNFNIIASGQEYKVHFKAIDGIKLNAPVTLNGLEVGRVKKIDIIYGNPTLVELTLWLKEEARLHEGAEASIKNMGFMGEKYVALSTGNDGAAFLAEKAVIAGQDQASFEKLLADGQVIAQNIKEISVQLNERLKVNSENIDDIFANMRVSMKNIASISTNVNERLEVNKHLIDDTIVHVNSASESLDEMSADLKLNPWKLLYKPKRESVNPK